MDIKIYLFRIKSVDMRYQVWKWGVIFTDNVSNILVEQWHQRRILEGGRGAELGKYGLSRVRVRVPTPRVRVRVRPNRTRVRVLRVRVQRKSYSKTKISNKMTLKYVFNAIVV